MSKTENAFAIIHFGSNVKYFELELYFCIMLAKYTTQNIIYMYSKRDTPISFVEQITPFVYRTVEFDDNEITYNVKFASKYASFNTLRTCDFIFAYNLVEYKKVCIIESDMVIMGNIDSIFGLNAPSIICYRCGDMYLNTNNPQTSDKEHVIRTCKEASGLNGGVMLIEPSTVLFETYKAAIETVANSECKYPNEALFEYVNNKFYNLPVIYNLSHYHTRNLRNYGLPKNGRGILIYHFNETAHKHLDIIKEGWLKANIHKPEVAKKYSVKRIPIEHFEETVYEPNNAMVYNILERTKEPPKELTKEPPKKSNWTEAFSEKYKRPYWFNKETGESVWVKPAELSGGKKRRQKSAKRVVKNTLRNTKKTH